MSGPPSGFQIRDVSSWNVVEVEPGGGEEKLWLSDPSEDVRWLFKPNRVHQQGDRRWSQQEGLSEKIAGELGVILGVPCAHIELATRNGSAGCISRDLKPRGWELQPGQVLLSGTVPNYVPGDAPENKNRKGHSLQNTRDALIEYLPPLNWPLGQDCDALAVFVGYLTFDALTGNQDRHDENWAIIRPIADSAQPRLAGSFDHARSFGSSLHSDTALKKIMKNGVDRWAARGLASRFEHSKPPGPCTLVELAAHALSMVPRWVRTHWLERVHAVEASAVAEVVARVPGMSDVAGTFVAQVYATNRRRVLDGC